MKTRASSQPEGLLISALSRFTQPSGICRYAVNLASSLAGSIGGANVSMALGAWQLDYFRDLFGATCPVNLLPVDIPNSSRTRNLWYWRDLPRLAENMNCAVVHSSFPAPLRRGAFKGLIVTTVHDMYAFDLPENFGFPAVLFNRAFFRQALRASDGVVCDSQETLNRLAYHFPRFLQTRKAAVVPCCVDFSRATPQAPGTLPFAADSPFVLCVGQHRKNKNLDLLIRAFAQLKSASAVRADLRLLIVGSPGPETEHLKQLALSSLPAGAVIFAAGVADNQLAWLYQHCQLLAIPSSQEGFCLPLVEGMYFGARIACSNIATLREVGSEKCIYFDLDSTPEPIAAAMLQGLGSPRPDYAGAVARFSPAAVAQLQTDFYQSLSLLNAAAETLPHVPAAR